MTHASNEGSVSLELTLHIDTFFSEITFSKSAVRVSKSLDPDPDEDLHTL